MRAFFREAPDGAAIFFPWGLTGRGYRLRDVDGKRQAERAASLLLGSVVALGTWGGHALHEAFRSGDPSLVGLARALAAPLGAVVLVLLAYGSWVSRFVESCVPSDLRISREERLREAADLAGPAKVIAIGAILAGLSALLVWLEPQAGWLGALGVVMGVGLALWGRVLQRAATRPSVPPTPGTPASAWQGSEPPTAGRRP